MIRLGRNYLADIINKNGYDSFVEVGVKKGDFSHYIITNTNALVIMVDPWTINVENKTPEEDWEFVNNRFKEFNLRAQLLRMDSLSAAKAMSNEKFDVVYIDALHDYESVKNDIDAWYPLVNDEGILAGHDYSDHWPGVLQAVQEFADKNKYEITVLFGDEGPGPEPSWVIRKNK